MDYEWPITFPEGVPPDVAYETEGNIFRVSKNLPPIRDDFKQYREEEVNAGKDFKGKHLINSYGASVFTEIKDAIRIKKLYENRLSNIYVVTGNLIPELGKMLKTYSRSHHTIWFQKNSQPQEHIKNEAAE